jgi:alkylation response protein AidB-like acyl-CoA dehydrogenase
MSSRAALQVHGAIGYTLECDISIWMQRVLELKTLGGSPQWHRDRILADLLARRNKENEPPRSGIRRAEMSGSS